MTTFTATLDGLTFTRNSKRAFTHAVIQRESISEMREKVEAGTVSQSTLDYLLENHICSDDTIYSLVDCASSLALAQKAAAKRSGNITIVELSA